MNDWFSWNGVKCTVYGIRVTRLPELVRPSERVNFTAVPGRSGTLTTLEGPDVYDDFLLSIECLLPDTSNLQTICAWLKGQGKLVLPNKPGGFYFAHVVNQIPFEQVLRGNPHKRFAVNLRCQPFFYLSNIPNITVTASGSYVNNIGSVFAEPVLKVSLTGDAQITIGASYIELLGLTGVVTVDTPLMETYKNYTSYNNHMTGDYPLLHTGQNLISWTGGVTQIVVTPNWRTL